MFLNASNKNYSNYLYATVYIAAQMWCLCRFLAFMIGINVSENEERWKCFLLLLEIIDYLMSPLTSSNAVSYLRMLIEDHHENFKRLYPNCTITPKFHFLIHYPEWINRYVL